MAKDDGGSAFPVQLGDVPEGHYAVGSSGMSLRDWYKGQALAGGLIAHLYDELSEQSRSWDEFCELIATCAEDIADAMLKEREK